MTKQILGIAVCVSALMGCATLANVGPDRHTSQTDAERATPSTRTSDDELDGPTAPRGSAYRNFQELEREENAEPGEPVQHDDR